MRFGSLRIRSSRLFFTEGIVSSQEDYTTLSNSRQNVITSSWHSRRDEVSKFVAFRNVGYLSINVLFTPSYHTRLARTLVGYSSHLFAASTKQVLQRWTLWEQSATWPVPPQDNHWIPRRYSILPQSSLDPLNPRSQNVPSRVKSLSDRALDHDRGQFHQINHCRYHKRRRNQQSIFDRRQSYKNYSPEHIKKISKKLSI